MLGHSDWIVSSPWLRESLVELHFISGDLLQILALSCLLAQCLLRVGFNLIVMLLGLVLHHVDVGGARGWPTRHSLVMVVSCLLRSHRFHSSIEVLVSY